MTVHPGLAFVVAPREYGCRMADHGNEDIVEQLRVISDTLGERSMDALRRAIDAGTGQRPAEEKILAQARRAVDKAITVLAGRGVTDD